MEHKLRKNKKLSHFISAPFLWMMIVPLLILDIFLEIYHRICFKLYKLEYVKRSRYIKIDRYKLSYLSFIDKFNCMYCGYANGLLHYASVIAGKTEEYFCAIKHEKAKDFIEPSHHREFLEYGDEKGFLNRYKK